MRLLEITHPLAVLPVVIYDGGSLTKAGIRAPKVLLFAGTDKDTLLFAVVVARRHVTNAQPPGYWVGFDWRPALNVQLIGPPRKLHFSWLRAEHGQHFLDVLRRAGRGCERKSHRPLDVFLSNHRVPVGLCVYGFFLDPPDQCLAVFGNHVSVESRYVSDVIRAEDW